MKTTAHRPSQSNLRHVINSRGQQVINTAYSPTSKTSRINNASGKTGNQSELYNSEALAWFRHATMQTRKPDESEYESDEETQTPVERAQTKIALSGILKGDKGSYYVGELPPLDSYKAEYYAPTDNFRTRIPDEATTSRKRWLIDRSRDWIDSLTSDEKRAVNKWTVNGHSMIGEYLEYGNIWKSETQQSLDDLQLLLHGALAKKGALLNSPIKVWRGISSDDFLDEAPDIHNIDMALSYIQKKFIKDELLISNDSMPRSATLSPKIAFDTFSSGRYPIILEITTSEIHSPVNLSSYGLLEEEVLIVGNIRAYSADIVDNVIVLKCLVD